MLGIRHPPVPSAPEIVRTKVLLPSPRNGGTLRLTKMKAYEHFSGAELVAFVRVSKESLKK